MKIKAQDETEVITGEIRQITLMDDGDIGIDYLPDGTVVGEDESFFEYSNFVSIPKHKLPDELPRLGTRIRVTHSETITVGWDQ